MKASSHRFFTFQVKEPPLRKEESLSCIRQFSELDSATRGLNVRFLLKPVFLGGCSTTAKPRIKMKPKGQERKVRYLPEKVEVTRPPFFGPLFQKGSGP